MALLIWNLAGDLAAMMATYIQNSIGAWWCKCQMCITEIDLNMVTMTFPFWRLCSVCVMWYVRPCVRVCALYFDYQTDLPERNKLDIWDIQNTVW